MRIRGFSVQSAGFRALGVPWGRMRLSPWTILVLHGDYSWTALQDPPADSNRLYFKIC